MIDWNDWTIVFLCTRPYTCPFSFCWWDTMHPFPPLVYTEDVRWTQETKGRKSDNMADYIVFLGVRMFCECTTFWVRDITCVPSHMPALFHSVDGCHLTVSNPGLHVVCTLDTGGKGQKVGEYGRLHTCLLPRSTPPSLPRTPLLDMVHNCTPHTKPLVYLTLPVTLVRARHKPASMVVRV